MGVDGLWKAIKPGCASETLLQWNTMRGKTLAVDLTHWIVESNTAMSNVHYYKPHLRNLFFRIKHFIELQVKLIFVLDGQPWYHKMRAFVKRYKANINGNRFEFSEQFTQKCKECADLLKLLSIPCITLSQGDAEAFCGHLNASGIVDGVISPDGDGMSLHLLFCQTVNYRFIVTSVSIWREKCLLRLQNNKTYNFAS